MYKYTTFYVSNDGDDSNNGRYSRTPWKTIAKVSSEAFNHGDRILFRRGDAWYENLIITSSGTPDDPITFGNYGKGDLPEILGSIALTKWTNVCGNIWVSDNEAADPSLGGDHEGQGRANGGWPGGAWFEEADGTATWGHMEKHIDHSNDFSELNEEYDWGWYDNHIYVYSNEDPGTAYIAMQVSQRQNCMGFADGKPQNHIIIDGIRMMYAQTEGFSSGLPAMEARGLTIRNCHVGYIGIKSGSAAYGLAVWHSDMLIRNNEIHDCGRRGISYNIYATAHTTFRNVIIEGNYFHHGYHTTGIDIANYGTDTIDSFVIRNNLFEGDPAVDLGAGEAFNSNHIYTEEGEDAIHTNFYFYNNIFICCHGKGLTISGITNSYIYHNTFFGVNPTLSNFQAQLLFTGTIINSNVRNNIFYNDVDSSFNGYFMCVKAEDIHVDEIDMDNNLYFTTDPNAIMMGVFGTGEYTMRDWTAYRRETGWDTNSPAPGNPMFTDGPNGDLHLSCLSPAIGAGVAIPGIATDYAGDTYCAPPSLGAYTYSTAAGRKSGCRGRI